MQGRKGKRVKCIALDDNQPISRFHRGKEGGVFAKPRMAENHFFCSVLRRQGRQGEARGGQVNVRERDDLPEERGKTDMSMPCLCHASPKAPCWPIDQCFFLNRRPRLYHRGSRAQACARAIFPMHHSSYLAKITVWNRVEVRLIQRLARWAATRVSALDRKSKHLQVS